MQKKSLFQIWPKADNDDRRFVKSWMWVCANLQLHSLTVNQSKNAGTYSATSSNLWDPIYIYINILLTN